VNPDRPQRQSTDGTPDERKARTMSAVHTTGETPGAGMYYCLVCGWRITLEPDQVMPVCGGCVRPVISRFSHLR
jgi:hypothetical protein